MYLHIAIGMVFGTIIGLFAGFHASWYRMKKLVKSELEQIQKELKP